MTSTAVFVSFHLQVEKELKSICNDILDVLDKHLILAATTGESKVFYYKMYVSKYVYVSFILKINILFVKSHTHMMGFDLMLAEQQWNNFFFYSPSSSVFGTVHWDCFNFIDCSLGHTTEILPCLIRVQIQSSVFLVINCFKFSV